jgi:hypothetical protein
MDIFYNINENLKNNNLDETKKLIDSIDITNIKNTKSYYSLLLRYYITTNDIKMIENIVFNNILMKRDYLEYFSYEKDISKCKKFVNIMLKKDEILNKDIDIIINKCPHILKLLDGYYCETKNKTNITKLDILKKYNINDLKDQILKFYDNKISNITCEYLNNYDIILDAGNIIYFGTNGTKPNYYNLLSVLSLLDNKNPLIIIHERHFKKKNNTINILKSLYPNNIFMTPYNNYDDYYIIYSMIYGDIPVISNDKYRDHIFDMFKLHYKNNVYNFNRVSNYIKDNIITYSLNKINYKPHHFNFSNCIQCINDNIYIPSKNLFYKL